MFWKKEGIAVVKVLINTAIPVTVDYLTDMSFQE